MCHNRVTKLCKVLRPNRSELSKMLETPAQHVWKLLKLRFWGFKMHILGVIERMVFQQSCIYTQPCVTNLCRVQREGTFDFLKSLKISAQVTQFLPELSFWEPKIAIPGWFGRTTSLNSSRIALKSIAWQFLKWEFTIVRLDGFGHSERVYTRFVAPNGASWVGVNDIWPI